MRGSRLPRYWAVILPLGSAQATSRHSKHYLEILGMSVLEWSLGPFLRAEWIDGVVLLLPQNETLFYKLAIARHPKIITLCTNGSRAGSMLTALNVVRMMTANLHSEVQVYIHDALRPCITLGDIERLANEADEEHGGVLATPLTDDLRTAIRDRAGEHITTQEVWRIQSPQLFQLDHLTEALKECISGNEQQVDEVTAMQLVGYRPRLVKGRQSNLKVAHPEDLVAAEFWLSKAEYLR